MKARTLVVAMFWLVGATSPAVAQETRIAIVADSQGSRLEASAPPGTVRAVWELSTSLTSPSWSVVAVQSDSQGRTAWTNSISSQLASAFYRVRTYDTPGFNAQLDRLIQKGRSR